jgi:hypothetical protein
MTPLTRIAGIQVDVWLGPWFPGLAHSRARTGLRRTARSESPSFPGRPSASARFRITPPFVRGGAPRCRRHSQAPVQPPSAPTRSRARRLRFQRQIRRETLRVGRHFGPSSGRFCCTRWPLVSPGAGSSLPVSARGSAALTSRRRLSRSRGARAGPARGPMWRGTGATAGRRRSARRTGSRPWRCVTRAGCVAPRRCAAVSRTS